MKKKQAIKKLLVPEEKLRAAMELFPGKTREEVREILFRKVVHRMKLGGCLSLLFLFVGIFVGKTSGVEQGVQREEPGGKGKAVWVQIETQNDPQEIVVEIGPREYESSQIEEFHVAAETYLETVVPGENKSLSRVTNELFFPEELPDSGSEVEWTTDAPWLITSDGKVLNAELAEPEQVLITAKIWYGSEYRCFSRTVTVYPAEYSAEEKAAREIQRELLALEETSRTEERFVFPETVLGYDILPVEKTSSAGRAFFFLLSFVIPIFFYYACFEKLEKDRKSRKEKAERCYTEFVTKFSLLLAAGISIRQAVNRLADEYERNYGSSHVLAEELKVTRQELEHGRSEMAVYEAFGNRIGVLAYRRMASLLTQNVSKGVQDIRILLFQEAKEVMAQERANTRQRGEQAGTKLLLPMMGLLLLVFAVLLVPAFQSF